MRRLPILLAPLALVLTLTACGNKGPLVRPGTEDIEDTSIDAEVEAEDVDAAEGDPDAQDDDASPPPVRDDG